MKKETLFDEIRDQHDEHITREMLDDALRALEEENFLQVTQHTVRLVTLGDSSLVWETGWMLLLLFVQNTKKTNVEAFIFVTVVVRLELIE